MPHERRRRTRSSTLTTRGALLVTLLLGGLAGLSACKNLPGGQPDVSRGKFRQTSRDISVREPPGRSADSRALVLLAQQRLQTGDIKAAEQLARKAVKDQPASADAHTVLGLVLDRKGDAPAAGASYRKATELAPNGGEVLNNFGVWLCGQGRAAESLAWFDRAVAAPGYSTPSAAKGNAGVCALSAGQSVRAERDLRAAISADPANALALGALAKLAFDAGRTMEARAFSERRLAAAPATDDALLLASQIEQKLGDTDAARRYVQKMRRSPAGTGAKRDGEQEGR
ncbi:MAG: Type IV pilus biogenesis protein PilF [uncultured Lysobacter sp.]|uniref:Type IV pilus biogenesis protein PilF n=1 Tax=uncultured Lysobacter sp. TaxID=271060 RepID=A0A6J4LXP6_9GAMM|nr:MAG: Type IV pilus biogenesis protein PilF [uncultured Lysobacter sp.]